jgi:hypothetical protein
VTIAWTTGPRSGFGLGGAGAGGVVSAIGGKDCVGFERPGGTAGERGRGLTRGIGAGAGREGTQAREGGDRTLGGGTIGGIGSWGVELIVTDLDAISALSSFHSFSNLPCICLMPSRNSAFDVFCGSCYVPFHPTRTPGGIPMGPRRSQKI